MNQGPARRTTSLSAPGLCVYFHFGWLLGYGPGQDCGMLSDVAQVFGQQPPFHPQLPSPPSVTLGVWIDERSCTTDTQHLTSGSHLSRSSIYGLSNCNFEPDKLLLAA